MPIRKIVLLDKEHVYEGWCQRVVGLPTSFWFLHDLSGQLGGLNSFFFLFSSCTFFMLFNEWPGTWLSWKCGSCNTCTLVGHLAAVALNHSSFLVLNS